MPKKTESVRPIKLNYEDDLHLMPMDDYFEHEPQLNCDCRPFPDPTNAVEFSAGLANKEVFVHRRVKEDKEGCQ